MYCSTNAPIGKHRSLGHQLVDEFGEDKSVLEARTLMLLCASYC